MLKRCENDQRRRPGPAPDGSTGWIHEQCDHPFCSEHGRLIGTHSRFGATTRGPEDPRYHEHWSCMCCLTGPPARKKPSPPEEPPPRTEETARAPGGEQEEHGPWDGTGEEPATVVLELEPEDDPDLIALTRKQRRRLERTAGALAETIGQMDFALGETGAVLLADYAAPLYAEEFSHRNAAQCRHWEALARCSLAMEEGQKESLVS